MQLSVVANKHAAFLRLIVDTSSGTRRKDKNECGEPVRKCWEKHVYCWIYTDAEKIIREHFKSGFSDIKMYFFKVCVYVK